MFVYLLTFTTFNHGDATILEREIFKTRKSAEKYEKKLNKEYEECADDENLIEITRFKLRE